MSCTVAASGWKRATSYSDMQSVSYDDGNGRRIQTFMPSLTGRGE
jgi:hypothetical protein